MLKKILFVLFLFSISFASYLTFDDTGRQYLTVSDDDRKIYLWDINGSLHGTAFPFILPDNSEIMIEPWFEDIDQDGELEILVVYRDRGTQKLYKQAIRQTGENYNEKIWPQEINSVAETAATTINPIIEAELVSLNGRAVFNKKYNYFLGNFRHSVYDNVTPSALAITDIYSKVPTAAITLANPDPDFDRYLIFYRKNTTERFQLFAKIMTPNFETVLTLNYPEGIYPWRFLTLDWVDNYTCQEINYYYDHTPPTYTAPSGNFEIYFSPNNDGVQDTAVIETNPSDNLYYRQTAILDIFDGPTYITSVKKDGLTFATINAVWNGYDNEGRLAPDKTYQAVFYLADGCGNMSATTTGTITLDTVPPAIWSQYANSTYFTPNGDGDLDTLIVTLNCSEPVKLVMNIYNLYNRQVKSINSSLLTTNYSLVWDGVDVDGIVENGTYKYNFILTDQAGNTYTSPFTEVYLDFKSPLIRNAGLEKEEFDFTKEEFRFTFDVVEPVYASLYILDNHGNRVATVNPGITIPTSSVFIWDGKAAGTIIPDGIYNYRLLVKNQFGNTGALTGAFIVRTWIPTANPVPTASPTTINVPASPTPDYSSIGLFVRTQYQPEPKYLNSQASVNYTIIFEKASKAVGFSIQSFTPVNIGCLTVLIEDTSGNIVDTVTADAALPAGSHSFSWTPPSGLASGRYYFHSYAKDFSGTRSESESRAEFVFDQVPPQLMGLSVLNTRQGIFLTTRRIDLDIQATDNLLPVTEMQFSSDGVSWSVPEAYSQYRYGYLSVTADGILDVYARVKDAAGNWSLPASAEVVIDASPPQHVGIIVDGALNGPALSLNTSLKFIASDVHGLAPTFKLSYNDAYSWVEYPYGITLNYILDPVQGLKYFYVKYKDTLGNETGIVTATVSLDRDPPYNVQTVRLSPYWTNTSNIQLKVTAQDDMLGVDKIEITGDGATVNYSYDPSLTLNWTIDSIEGTKNLRIVAIDKAGNRSNSVSLSCIYDITPPVIITSSISLENIYLPTLKTPFSIALTANEETILSVNIVRGGEEIYKRTVSNNFSWSGENQGGRYIRPGSVCDIAYQVIDLAGNVGTADTLRVTLDAGYCIATANYDLFFPSLEATSKSIHVEYEDDPAYSIGFMSAYLWNTPSRRGSNTAYPGETKTKASYRILRWIGPNNAGACTCYATWTIYIDGETGYEQSYYGNNNQQVDDYAVLGAGTFVVSEYADDFGGPGQWMYMWRKSCSRIESVTGNYCPELKSVNIERMIKIYTDLEPSANQGSLGNISNNYSLTIDPTSKNILLCRNGETINVTNYPTDNLIKVAEPAMYICKNFYDKINTDNHNAVEDVHIVWQQKNTPTDNWRIYYTVVPFYYEDFLNEGHMSIMSAPRMMAAPGITFKNPLNGDYTGTKPLVEISVFDNDGISTNSMYIRLNDSATTYDVSSLYVSTNATEGTIKFTLGQDAGVPLGGGKNMLTLHLIDNNGVASEGSVWVQVKQGLFVENILNYPNPFTNDTTLTYMLTDETTEVKARIYTITGRLIKELTNLPAEPGYNEYFWNGKDNNDNELANDVYYLVVMAKGRDGKWVKGRSKLVKLK